MAGAMLLAAALAAGWTISIKPASQVDLGSREIRLADVVELEDLPARERARLGARVVARLPAGRSRISLSRQALASLIRRSVPALRPEAGPPGEMVFTLAPQAVPAAAELDRAAAVELPAVKAGAKLTLVSQAGRVRLEREVTALQPGRAGGRVFVRDGDGEIFSVTVAEEAR